MNKKKVLSSVTIALASIIFVLSDVSAQEIATVKTEKTADAKSPKVVNSDVAPKEAGETIETQAAEKEKAKKEKSKESKGKVTGESHRSSVAAFVQSLLAVADREGGIGKEVREIAKQQNDNKDRASDIINAVNGRNKVKTFFIGTSYKNLGELRSQMVQTKNQINQLKQLAEKASTPQDKAELLAQVQVLEKQQADIDGFIARNESNFSLFGWAVKLFRK